MRRIFAFIVLILTACSSQNLPSAEMGLYAIRLATPALVRFSSDLQMLESETPLDLPPACTVSRLSPAPIGSNAALEMMCPFGPTVLLLDLTNGKTRPLVSEPGMDSHFLAWDADGKSLFLRMDSMNEPRIVRADLNGKLKSLMLTGLTYHISVAPNGKTLAHTFTRGIGYGSELWLADARGNTPRLLLAETTEIIAFASWSPDGESIAYLLMPDSSVPFPDGELWLVDANNGTTRFLAAADAGHGYAFAWSPDGERIVFVGRDNPTDAKVQQSASALHSNLYTVDLRGEVEKITDFTSARVETPQWSPDGNYLAFPVVLNGKMTLWVHNLDLEETVLLNDNPSCCPAWVGK